MPDNPDHTSRDTRRIDDPGWKKIYCKKCGAFIINIDRETSGGLELNCRKCGAVVIVVIQKTEPPK